MLNLILKNRKQSKLKQNSKQNKYIQTLIMIKVVLSCGLQTVG